MTTLQIIGLIFICLGIVVALGFFIAFIVEVTKGEQKEQTEQKEDENEEAKEVNEIDIDAMLAQLEENAEKKEEPAKEETTEDVDIDAMLAKLESEAANNQAEEEKKEEAPVEEAPAENKEEEKEDDVKTTVIIKKIVKEGPEFDYRVRLEKIKDSMDKVEKDLDKTEKAITKYERTSRRLARNQKLLDRRAGELANLNLLMYNVTDIKNIDEEKKARQEELVAHISELKASIEDAEKYLAANAEKHANNLKLRDYLQGEKARYTEELAELEALIAQSEGKAPKTTVETQITTVSGDAAPSDDGENK